MLAVMLYECADCLARNPGPLHCCCNSNTPQPNNTFSKLPKYSPWNFSNFPKFPKFGFNKCSKEGRQLVDLHQFDKPDQLSSCDIRMGCVDCGKVNPGHLHCCC